MSHLQIQLEGSSPGGEIWSTSLRYSSVVGVNGRGPGDFPLNAFNPQDTLEQLMDAVFPVVSGLESDNALLEGMSTSLHIRTVRLNYMNSEGKLTHADERAFPTGKSGTGTLTRPLQTSVVASLNYGARFSKSDRGRIYWPFLSSFAAMSGPYIAAAWQNQYLNEMNTFQADLGDAVNSVVTTVPACTLIVFSPTLKSCKVVENLSVDNVPDVQRRRANDLPATRLIAARE